MLVRSKRTTVLKRVTAACMEEIPASATRSSHVPGRSANVEIVLEHANVKAKSKKRLRQSMRGTGEVKTEE